MPSSAAIKGQGFEFHVDFGEGGTLRRYSLRKGGHLYMDMDANGEANLRMSDSLAPDSKEIRINGDWIKAPNNLISVSGMTYKVHWENGWKTEPVE